MAGKVRGIQNPRRGARIKGAATAYWSDKWQQYVYRSWTTSKGPKTPLAVASSAQFTQSTQILKQLTPMDYIAASGVTQNSPFLNRDVMMLATYGKLIEVMTRDGKYIGSNRVIPAQTQTMLDSVTNQPGAMLIRTEDGWVGLLPGTDGQLLEMDSGLPAWATPSTQWPVLGITNGTAIAAGYVGEHIQFKVERSAEIAWADSTNENLLSFTLQPGVWAMSGSLGLDSRSGSAIGEIFGWFNTVSATRPAQPSNGAMMNQDALLSAGQGLQLALGIQYVNISVPTLYYLSGTSVTNDGQGTFAYGVANCVRIA